MTRDACSLGASAPRPRVNPSWDVGNPIRRPRSGQVRPRRPSELVRTRGTSLPRHIQENSKVLDDLGGTGGLSTSGGLGGGITGGQATNTTRTRTDVPEVSAI